MIYQETKIAVVEEEIIFLNPQFTSESNLFIKKRGIGRFSLVSSVASLGQLKVKSVILEKLLHEHTAELVRFDLFVSDNSEKEFQKLFSGEELESNQYEKILSTSHAHQFIKIYTTLDNTLAIAIANFREGIVLTDLDNVSKTLKFRSFSTDISGIKRHKGDEVITLEIENDSSVIDVYQVLKDLSFSKKDKLVSISKNNRTTHVKYGLIRANSAIEVNSYETFRLNSNAKQDVVKVERINSLDTSKLEITQHHILNHGNFKFPLKMFLKRRNGNEYHLLNSSLNFNSFIEDQKNVFNIIENECCFSGIYDFFFSDIDEQVYYPLNLTTPFKEKSIYAENHSISLRYYATKNDNLAIKVEQIASTGIQSSIVSYDKNSVIVKFEEQIEAASLLIVKRKDKSEKYSITGVRLDSTFDFLWSDVLEELSKKQIGGLYDLYVSLVLPNGEQVVRSLINIQYIDNDAASVEETENKVAIVEDGKQRYLHIIDLINDSESIHNQSLQLYLTLNSGWSIHKGRAYNLRKTNYKVETKVIGYAENKASYTINVLVSNKTNSHLDYLHLSLVNRNRLVHIETVLETENIDIDGGERILTATFSPNTDMSPFYYDLFVLVNDLDTTDEPFYIPIKTVNNEVKHIIDNDTFAHNRFIGDYVMYPYITNFDDLAFEYRMSEKFETNENYLKEIKGEKIATQLANKLGSEKIWIVFEKNAQGGHDNGFHFFKYMMEHTDRKNIYYVIDPNSPEYKNLLPYRDNILEFMSEKYFVYLFLADLLISSDTKFHVYNTHVKSSPLGKAISKKELVFLQHGVNGIKRVPAFHKTSNLLDYICVPDEYEKQMVIKEWGYKADKVAVTGLARWDSYSDKTDTIPYKQIFVMPTWRKWMDGMTHEQFIETQFYQEYAKLLSSSKLKKVILDNNARISFFLHPYFKDYVDLFDIDESFIDKYGYLDIDMGEEIQKSSLMISDYSSVMWDMLYLDKPVIFFQFDQEEYLISEGTYMDYKTELFGDVVFNSEEIINNIEQVVARDFKLEEKYSIMREKYFTYIDQNNSERIYHAIEDMTRKVPKPRKVHQPLNVKHPQNAMKFFTRVIRKVKREILKFKKR